MRCRPRPTTAGPRAFESRGISGALPLRSAAGLAQSAPGLLNHCRRVHNPPPVSVDGNNGNHAARRHGPAPGPEGAKAPGVLDITMTRDMTKREFVSKLRSYGFRPVGLLGYVTLPDPPDCSVSVLNAGKKRRAQLAYLLAAAERHRKKYAQFQEQH